MNYHYCIALSAKHERDGLLAYSFHVLLNGTGFKKNPVNIKSHPVPSKNPIHVKNEWNYQNGVVVNGK